MYPPSNFRRYLPYAIILLAYLAGMFVDIMEIDAAQYATMARDMLRNGDFLQLHDRGNNYLDKPPLTFWMTILSFKAFGVSTWAYKLPSVLFSLLAIWGTEKLCTVLYNRRTAQFAGLILASSQAFFLMNNDVKTDMYMIAPMVIAIWLLARSTRAGNWMDVLIAGFVLGVGMLGKGPITIVAAALALGADLALRGDWKQLLHWKWLLIFPGIFLVTLPFDIGLFKQYGWKGVEFFYWTQSFGRVTGESEWTNDATWFFFVHTFAWSFLPWTLLFLGALFYRLKKLIQAGFVIPSGGEALSMMGFLLVFTALCFSRFKLPHYIFVTYPFAAILCAGFLVEMQELQLLHPWRKFFLRSYQVIWVLALLLANFLIFYIFPESPVLPKIIFAVLSLALTFDAFLTKDDWVRFIWPTALGFALINLGFNLSIFPSILSFQSTSVAGKYVMENSSPEYVYAYQKSGRALDFYGGEVARQLADYESLEAQAKIGGFLLYTDADGFRKIEEAKLNTILLLELPHNPPNKLSLPFLNPNTRKQRLSYRYLLRFPKP